MPETYNPTATNHASFTLPNDGEAATADSVKDPLRDLADKAHFLDTLKLRDIVLADSSIPIIGTTSDSHDHPSSASNKWRLVLRAAMHDGVHIRLYAGDNTGGTGGTWAVTVNAIWNPASGDQFWTKDNTGQLSSILLSDQVGGLQWLNRAVGAGSWTSWTAGTGIISVGGDVLVGDDLQVAGEMLVSGAAQVLQLGLPGTATVLDQAAGNLRVNGPLDVVDDVNSGADIVAADDLVAGSDFLYNPPPSRTVIIPVLSGGGLGTVSFAAGQPQVDFANAGDPHSWPIQLPHGAAMGTVDVIAFKAGSGTMNLSLRGLGSFDFTSPVTNDPTDVEIDAGSNAGSGLVLLTASFGGQTVDNSAASYHVRVSAGDAADVVYALRITFTDPGPRNH